MKTVLFLLLPALLCADYDPDRLFEATLYEEAIPLYMEESGEKGTYRLALSYYHSGLYLKTVKTVEESSSLSPEERYLLALAKNKLGRHAEAAEHLKQLLHLTTLDPPQMSFDALFELGRTYFLWDKKNAAREIFLRFSDDPDYRVSSSLFLAKLDLKEQNYEEARNRLQEIEAKVPPESREYLEYWHLRGSASYRLKAFDEAKEHFKTALSIPHPENGEWHDALLYNEGLSLLRLAQSEKREMPEGVSIFETLYEKEPKEEFLLALGQLLLLQGKNDSLEALLNRHPKPLSREANMQALLLLAEGSQDTSKKQQYFRQLTQESNKNSPLYGKAWYLKGISDWKEKRYNEAAVSFEKAYRQLKGQDPELAGKAIQFTAESLYLKGRPEEALEFLAGIPQPDQFVTLSAKIAAASSQRPLAIQTLRNALEESPSAADADEKLLLLGSLYFEEKEYPLAEESFLLLLEKTPDSPLIGEALFYAAKCQPEPEASRALLKRVYEEHPDSPFAAEAFFALYSYQDYLQGSREAVKHLEQFRSRYPDSPLVMNADYLIGLDYKRDRKSPEGRWIRKQNLAESIDAFKRAQLSFDRLSAASAIPEKERDYYVRLRFRAMLERGRACLEVAEQSQGAKSQVYLEYAEETLAQIQEEFRSGNSALTAPLVQNEPYPILLQEAQHLYARTLAAAQKEEAAKTLLASMLDEYRQQNITRGYFLSRVWYDLGSIAYKKGEIPLAKEAFAHAEEAARGRVLNTDEMLDLWIQQSLCCQEMGELKEAMLTLSNVINSDAVSALRIKAMVLRADLYEQQGRFELARNQLDAASRKGGIWGKYAKQKLEEKYAYPNLRR